MKEEVTLIAAAIAAVASLLSLLFGIMANKRTELREAQRAALEPFVSEIGSELYALIAASKRMGLSKNTIALYLLPGMQPFIHAPLKIKYPLHKISWRG